MKILLIEDELKTVTFIKKGLEESSYDVDIATDGKTGLQMAVFNPYELIITDIILPELNGKDLCKALRAAKVDTPILILSALSTTDDVVTGLDIGADDYLVKPFEFRELLARIRAITKRKGRSNEVAAIVQLADLQLNLETRVVKRADQVIELTAKEFLLLEYFLKNAGKIISRAELARSIWGVDFDTGTNMVEVYVNYLRKKIDKGFTKKLLHTQFGMGYVLREE